MDQVNRETIGGYIEQPNTRKRRLEITKSGIALHVFRCNVFLQNLKLALTQFPVGASKSNEPGCLKQHLDELLSLFPVLQLLTGDAIYLQRPLLEALREHGVDYLFRVKENQPDTMEALETCFAEEHLDTPVQTVEKKRTLRSLGDCTVMSAMPSTFGTR
jgi:hypothetical protein